MLGDCDELPTWRQSVGELDLEIGRCAALVVPGHDDDHPLASGKSFTRTGYLKCLVSIIRDYN